MRSRLLALALLTTAASAEITYNAGTKVFRLDSSSTTYAFGVNAQGELQAIYFGGALGANDPLPTPQRNLGNASFDMPVATTPYEYAGQGGELFVEPALKITFPDGNRDLVLHYFSHHIDANTLTITLRDISRAVDVDLRYTLDSATGILGRSATITNHITKPFTVEEAAAATFSLPRGDDYALTYLSGRWASEDQLTTAPIKAGETILESKRGSTGHQNAPWFAIQRHVPADDHTKLLEDSGDTWFGELAWSGSWRIAIEQDALRQVRVTGGYNPFDFGYKLVPGEHLDTPVFYAGFTHHGMGEASRMLHRFQLASILPQKPMPKPRPVLYNSWEATGFDVTEKGQEALAEKAARIGAERFTMDDGWFGQRKTDNAGLGDWYVNKQKFPDGLKPLIDRVHALGMDFGLWVEPEMVNPDSDLYRKHPDWVLNFTGRPRSEARQQLVLNLARPDVRAYVFGFLNDLVAHNDIAFLKWDYNRNWAESGWPAVAPDEEKKVYVEYVNNFYGILRELRAKYPKLEIESCSGGGGRVDLGVMALTDEVWPSDNTDPFDRLSIQDGFTYAYTPGVMMSWVTDSPSWANNRATTLTYRFLSSMQGGLGIGANLDKWKDEDFTTATAMVAAYKRVRETVQHGALYRLVSPRNGSEVSATESVSADKKQAVLFAFLHSSTMNYPFPALHLQGLDPDATYTITPIAGQLTPGSPAAASGRYWMEHGAEVAIRGDFQAAAFELIRQ